MADVRVLDELILEAGAFYVMDRAYVDFQRRHRFVLAAAFYVTRSKSNLQYRRLESRPVEAGTGIRSDQIIGLRIASSVKHYPNKLRRIHYLDQVAEKSLVFLTNNFELPPLIIAWLYKSRWQVELFFKWIKQNLRIKHFFGNSDNAVKTQIWISIAVYVLVAIVRKELKLEKSLSHIFCEWANATNCRTENPVSGEVAFTHVAGICSGNPSFLATLASASDPHR